MKQFNVFGDEVKVVEELIPQPQKKTKTMQEMYGEIKDKTCKTCKHCERWGYNRQYYKCALWMDFFRGHSAASDIRLKNVACGKWEERKREENA